MLLPKVSPPIDAVGHAVKVNKKQYFEKAGLTNDVRCIFLLLHKQMHDKKGVAYTYTG